MTTTLGGHVAREERTEERTEAPTVAEAAELIRGSLDLGTVARLDYFHAALTEAYQRGRTAGLDQAQLWDLQ